MSAECKDDQNTEITQITEYQEYTQLLIKYKKHWNTQNSQENNNIIT